MIDTSYFTLQFSTICLNFVVLTGVIKSFDTCLKIIDPYVGIKLLLAYST